MLPSFVRNIFKVTCINSKPYASLFKKNKQKTTKKTTKNNNKKTKTTKKTKRLSKESLTKSLNI